MSRTSFRETTFVFLAALVIIFAVRWDALRLPCFGDEASYYVPLTYTLYSDNFHLSLHWVDHLEEYHPPLFFLVIAALTRIFGWSFTVMRIGSFLFGALFLTATYLLARLRCSRLLAAGVVAAVLSSPVVLSQTALIQPDLPMAAFALMSTYFLLTDRFRTASVFFLLGVFTNLTLFALTPVYALILWDRLEGAKIKKLLAFFAPAVAVSALWVAYVHDVQSGFYVFKFNNNADLYFLRGSGDLLKKAFAMPARIFLWDGRWTMTAALIATFLVIKSNAAKGEKWFYREAGYLLAMLGVETAFLIFFGVGLQRYFLEVLPYLFILAAWNIAVSPRAIVMYVAAAVYGVGCWFGAPDTYSTMESRHAYTDFVRCVQWAANKVENRPDHPAIFTHWPLHEMLTVEPDGFIEKRQRMIRLANFGGNLQRFVQALSDKTQNITSIVVYHENGAPFSFAAGASTIQSFVFQGECDVHTQGWMKVKICER